MNIQGTYTKKGLALAAKTAAGACLRVTRVVGGSGHTTDIPNAAALPEIRQTLAVGEARCAGSTAVLPVTLAAVGQKSTYTLTELGVYAEDPNEGEILYCVYRLDEPVTIQAGSDTVLRFYLRQTVSKDGGAAVLCSPAGLITESDCGPVRKKVLATDVPDRTDSIPASELQAYLDALPRLLTEHYVITLSGTASEEVSVNGFYGCGSLTICAADLGGCVFTRGISVNNCSVPVKMEKLKWAIGADVPQDECCITCSSCEVIARECSFNGYVSPAGDKTGRGATTINRAYLQLRDCQFRNLLVVVKCFGGGQIDVIEPNEKGEYRDNSVGAYTQFSGLIMLMSGIPSTLGGTGNTIDGGAIVQDGKFI